jgi:hypothetical protein
VKINKNIFLLKMSTQANMDIVDSPQIHLEKEKSDLDKAFREAMFKPESDVREKKAHGPWYKPKTKIMTSSDLWKLFLAQPEEYQAVYDSLPQPV